MKDREQLEAERIDREGEEENRHSDFMYSLYGRNWDLHDPRLVEDKEKEI